MRTSEAVLKYVDQRQLRGCQFAKGARQLSAFCRFIEDKELSEITVQEVAGFLDKSPPLSTTWRSRYLTLRKFLRFWSFRDAMPVVVMPPLPKPVESDFIPYIYSRGEIKRLLRATRELKSPQIRSIDPKGFRTLLITMYATGAYSGQLVNLLWSDVDLDKGFLTLKQTRFERVRTIPISEELVSILRVHRRRQKANTEGEVFIRRDGKAITSDLATRAFIRTRRIAGIGSQHRKAQKPTLHDLRSTFAVHRIDDWTKKGKDLNRLLPALSAYMGSTGLLRSERFMHLAPERFRRELTCLSPKRGRGHWRDDAPLMSFLSSL
jgi:integrase